MSVVQERKAALRARLLAARRDLSAADRARAATAVATHVRGLPEVAAAGTVAAYVSMGAEIGTAALLDELHASGRRVLLPVVLPDLDLNWACYAGPGSVQQSGTGRFPGLSEPVGPRLGPEAVAGADVVLVPGVAADRAGRRLGRGGGSYDRALARVPGGRLVAVLIYDRELVDEVPTDDHDRRVGMVVRPSGVYRICG